MHDSTQKLVTALRGHALDGVAGSVRTCYREMTTLDGQMAIIGAEVDDALHDETNAGTRVVIDGRVAQRVRAVGKLAADAAVLLGKLGTALRELQADTDALAARDAEEVSEAAGSAAP